MAKEDSILGGGIPVFGLKKRNTGPVKMPGKHYAKGWKKVSNQPGKGGLNLGGQIAQARPGGGLQIPGGGLATPVLPKKP